MKDLKDWEKKSLIFTFYATCLLLLIIITNDLWLDNVVSMAIGTELVYLGTKIFSCNHRKKKNIYFQVNKENKVDGNKINTIAIK